MNLVSCTPYGLHTFTQYAQQLHITSIFSSQHRPLCNGLGRRFFISSENSVGCAHDSGWLLIQSRTLGGCMEYDLMQDSETPPNFIYADHSEHVNWASDSEFFQFMCSLSIIFYSTKCSKQNSLVIYPNICEVHKTCKYTDELEEP